MMTMMKSGLLAAALGLSFSTFAAAQDFVVGVSGAVTGPTASTYAPTRRAMRIYFDRINRMGGINGKKVRFITLDDQGEPSRAATNARRLVTQENLNVLVGAGPSATITPMIVESERGGMPLVFAGSVCPQQSYPPAKETVFCTTGFGVSYDNRAMIDFIANQYGTKFKIGFAAMAIPVSRTGIDIAEARAKELGMTSSASRSSARNARLHPVRDQASGRPARLGILLGALDRANQDVRGSAKTRLERPLHDLGAHRSRKRDDPPQGSGSGADRRERVVQ